MPQDVQVEELVAPVVVEYFPAPQAVQELETAPLYLPAPQAVQELEPAPLYLPAPQAVQVEELVAPVVVEYLPAPQARQVEELVAPVVVEYFPAAQFAQSVLLYSSACAELPYFPAPQLVQ